MSQGNTIEILDSHLDENDVTQLILNKQPTVIKHLIDTTTSCTRISRTAGDEYVVVTDSGRLSFYICETDETEVKTEYTQADFFESTQESDVVNTLIVSEDDNQQIVDFFTKLTTAYQ
jgi:pyruvate formate-lyase activating enzyme-like uncharacterized protein